MYCIVKKKANNIKLLAYRYKRKDLMNIKSIITGMNTYIINHLSIFNIFIK
jgi:hypothetical protein